MSRGEKAGSRCCAHCPRVSCKRGIKSTVVFVFQGWHIARGVGEDVCKTKRLVQEKLSQEASQVLLHEAWSSSTCLQTTTLPFCNTQDSPYQVKDNSQPHRASLLKSPRIMTMMLVDTGSRRNVSTAPWLHACQIKDSPARSRLVLDASVPSPT